jgi:putative transposase
MSTCLYDDRGLLEDENARLKKLLADAMLDNAALKDLLSKTW